MSDDKEIGSINRTSSDVNEAALSVVEAVRAGDKSALEALAALLAETVTQAAKSQCWVGKVLTTPDVFAVASPLVISTEVDLVDPALLFELPATWLEMQYNVVLAAILIQVEAEALRQIDECTVKVRLPDFTYASFSAQPWTIGPEAPTTMIMAVDLMRDVFADAKWHDHYLPVEKSVLFTEGRFGQLDEITTYTDGFRYDTMRTLDPGNFYLFGSAPGSFRLEPATYTVDGSKLIIKTKVHIEVTGSVIHGVVGD